MTDVELSPGERIIIRNQRLIMIALANLVRDNTQIGNEYHADKLIGRVKQLEQAFDWVASPGERLG